MRWQILRFSDPVLAYSDQPVVVWPTGVELIDKRPTGPALGPLGALEIKFPLNAHMLLLMTWEDLDDIPEQAFLNAGGVDDVHAKSKQLESA